MRTYFLLLLLLTIAASAQPEIKLPVPETVTPQISIDPAAKALLDKATAVYKAANGLSFESIVINSPQQFTRVKLAQPNLLRVDFHQRGTSSHLLCDGQSVFSIFADSYQKEVYKVNINGWSGNYTLATQVIMPMLQGKNPINSLVGKYLPFDNKDEVKVDSLGSRLVDGDVLRGIRVRYSVKTTLQSNENTMWFGSDSTLRRYQVILKRNSSEGIQITTVQERILNQQLNPIFAPDTFKFDATGLKLLPR